MKCIIPCAGRGTRLEADVPKPLVRIGGRTLLEHIMRRWSTSVEGFVIVASRYNYRYFDGIPAEVVIQEEQKGLADAILCGESIVGRKFIVTLGDCLYIGKFQETKGIEL